MQFKLLHTSSVGKSRAGVLHTQHGLIETPIFMPVGTLGTVKGISQEELHQSIHAQIILGNSYHLYLRPGSELLHNAGGLHSYMGWNGPILTDSGGYQVYSLSGRRKIDENGVTFASHIDGSKHLFTPENVVDLQRNIGSDIMMAFDECPPYPSTKQYVEQSMHLTHRWLDRCFRRFHSTEPKYGFDQILAPIVQGGTYPDLRAKSAAYVASKNAEVNAIGGLSVGEPHDLLYQMTEYSCDHLPESKARYLMGVGTPENILECVDLGVDMFDCVLPSRNARHGLLYTWSGIINIKNKKWESDFSPIDETLSNGFSNVYSKSYLRHLIHVKEQLGSRIATIQNLSFFLDLITKARKEILADRFRQWKEQTLEQITRRL